MRRKGIEMRRWSEKKIGIIFMVIRGKRSKAMFDLQRARIAQNTRRCRSSDERCDSSLEMKEKNLLYHAARKQVIPLTIAMANISSGIEFIKEKVIRRYP